MRKWPVEELDAGCAEFHWLEEVLADTRAIIEEASDGTIPRGRETIEEVEDSALHLPHDEFFLLLNRLEAGFPQDTDPVWRDDIRRRIAAVPAEVERRYRESFSGGNPEDASHARSA